MDRQTYEAKLNYSCRDDVEADWKAEAPIPPKIMFELTNACNHRCIFCYNPKMKREAGYLTRDAFLRIGREARSLGVTELALYTTGESLLHPDCVEFVRLA